MMNKIDTMMFLLDLYSNRNNIATTINNIKIEPYDGKIYIDIEESLYLLHLLDDSIIYFRSINGYVIPGNVIFGFDYKKIYSEIKECQKYNSTVEQLILTFGRDPFGISVLLDDIKEHTEVDFAKEVFDYMDNSKL